MSGKRLWLGDLQGDFDNFAAAMRGFRLAIARRLKPLVNWLARAYLGEDA